MLLRFIHDFLRSCQSSRCFQILFNWLFPCRFQSDEFFICRIFSGGLIILIGLASRWIKSNSSSFWLYLTRANKRDPQSFKLYFVQVQNLNSYILWLTFLSWKFKFETLFQLFIMFQVILVAISSIMVWLSTSHRSQNRELLSLHQFINWSVAGKSLDLLFVLLIVYSVIGSSLSVLW